MNWIQWFARRLQDTPPTRHGIGMDRMQTRLLQAAVIILAVLCIYSPTYHGDWLWDDDLLLTRNPTVQHRVSTDPGVPPNSLGSLIKLWFNSEGTDYFPLSYTALWAQWPFFGQESTGYHVTSILLHGAGALLLWALLAHMRIPGAWLSGLVFAIHPVCVESVAWVSETKNTLAQPLFLLSALYWVRQDKEAGQAGWDRHYWLSIAFFLLAMLAKTSSVAFPVVTLLHAAWRRGTVTRRDLILALPLFTISIVLGLVTISFQWGRSIGVEKINIGDLLSPGGFASRTAVAGMALGHYVQSLVWPANLLAIYPRWEVDPPKAWMFLAWPAIAAALGGMWWKRNAVFPPRWGRHALFAFGFFFLMVAPVLGFVTIAYMRITWVADHFIYLPSISLLALVCAGANLLMERAWVHAKPALMTIGTLALVSLALVSFRDATHWANEDTLWTHTLRHNFDAWQAHSRLGAKKFDRGDIDGALFHFQNATRLRPDLGETHNNLGTALMTVARTTAERGNLAAATNQLATAIEHLATACRVSPQVGPFHVNLANALNTSGRHAEAVVKYQEILAQDPRNAAMINNLGVALYKQGRKDESIALFRRALEIVPDLKDALLSLDIALKEKNAPPTNSPPTAPKPDQNRSR